MVCTCSVLLIKYCYLISDHNNQFVACIVQLQTSIASNLFRSYCSKQYGWQAHVSQPNYQSEWKNCRHWAIAAKCSLWWGKMGRVSKKCAPPSKAAIVSNISHDAENAWTASIGQVEERVQFDSESLAILITSLLFPQAQNVQAADLSHNTVLREELKNMLSKEEESNEVGSWCCYQSNWIALHPLRVRLVSRLHPRSAHRTLTITP